MSELKLFTSMSRKIFHDLINPASAALNGLELLNSTLKEEHREIIDTDILDLIQASIEKITSQIKFYRYIYSGINNNQGSEIPKSQIDKLIQDYTRFTKLEVSLDIVSNTIRYVHSHFLSNFILLFTQLFPAGAHINVQLLDDKKIQITATPIAGKINSETFEDLSTRAIGDIENIQAEYLRRLLTSLNINYKINLSAKNNIKILQV
tara:strand:+ start:68 stop:688 length:621 start_codon:yes stop_codon:yes gene_type:complete